MSSGRNLHSTESITRRSTRACLLSFLAATLVALGTTQSVMAEDADDQPEIEVPASDGSGPIQAPAGKAAAKQAAPKRAEGKAEGREDLETKKFGDWAVVCASKESKEAKGECRMVQSAMVNIPAKDGAEARQERVMLSAIGYAPQEKQPLLSVIVPLGVLLQPGLLLDAEGYDQVKLPLQRCDSNGCLAFLPLKDALISTFRKAKEAQITFFNMAGKPNKIRVSLTGFGTAFEELGKHRSKG